LKHLASRQFWSSYEKLPAPVRQQADAAYTLLKSNPAHPSLRLKKVGTYWSVRVGLRYRALAVGIEDGLLWFWIGNHADYDALVSNRR
jgi:hypothetical protein